MEWRQCRINSAYKSDTLNQICIGIKFSSDVSYNIFWVGCDLVNTRVTLLVEAEEKKHFPV